MKPQGYGLPLLEEKLRSLEEGAMYQMSRHDYRRLFGENDAALGRLRNFAEGHQCVASFADNAILFRKRFAKRPNQRIARLPER